jgi:Flp pilus assembly protein TadD
VFARQGNLAQAAVELRAALELDPRNAGVHNDLGTVFALEGDFKEAAAEFEAALRLDPGLRTARENLERARARLAKKD